MAKNKGGRPSIYTPELADEICNRIASGRTTLSVSRDEDMPALSTIYDWRDSGKHPMFSEMYARAREKLCQHWADEIVEDSLNQSRDQQERVIKKDGYSEKLGTYNETVVTTSSDNTAVQRDKLIVDTKKWLLARLRPKEYGDKIEQQLTGKDGAEFQPILNITIEKKG